uniref:Putative secreted peptide n=1 Tax=Anopheles braziliensis TaxID=58242 RepID=A0A2M3ZW23_9DIPT
MGLLDCCCLLHPPFSLFLALSLCDPARSTMQCTALSTFATIAFPTWSAWCWFVFYATATVLRFDRSQHREENPPF